MQISLPGNALNIKVEILEEDKPIIEKLSGFIGATDNELIFNISEIKDKLNEIIDYINRKEDK